MKKQIGVWINLKKAVITSLEENNHEIKTIYSSIEGRERIPGEKKAFTRFGNQVLEFGKKKQNRLANEKKEYLKKVLNELKGADEIVLSGPAGMKTELEKLIQDDTDLSSRLKGVETTDRMTENQIVAWVKKYFEGKIKSF
ncbi:MAG TPA: hypothetical protein VIL78_18650 [Hanamia sp.]